MLYFFYRSQILGQLKIAGFIRPRGAGDIRDLNSNSNNLAVVKVGSFSGKLNKAKHLFLKANKVKFWLRG